MSFTDIYRGPRDLLVGLFYVVCFGALQSDGMFRCACTLFSAQVMFAGLALLERTFSSAVKQGVREATDVASDVEDADSQSGESEDANESNDGASDSEAAREDACNKDMLEKADKLLTAAEKEMDAAQAELFYRMFVRGVLEFVHDGYVFSIHQRVRVKRINE